MGGHVACVTARKQSTVLSGMRDTAVHPKLSVSPQGSVPFPFCNCIRTPHHNRTDSVFLVDMGNSSCGSSVRFIVFVSKQARHVIVIQCCSPRLYMGTPIWVYFFYAVCTSTVFCSKIDSHGSVVTPASSTVLGHTGSPGPPVSHWHDQKQVGHSSNITSTIQICLANRKVAQRPPSPLSESSRSVDLYHFGS